MPAEVHLIDVDHKTFCGARTPKEWNRTAYTPDGAKAVAGTHGEVCVFCSRAWEDPEYLVRRAVTSAEKA